MLKMVVKQKEDALERLIGRIETFIVKENGKGTGNSYGFIRPKDGRRDAFFLAKHLPQDYRPTIGDIVEYEMGPGIENRLEAKNIVLKND